MELFGLGLTIIVVLTTFFFNSISSSRKIDQLMFEVLKRQGKLQKVKNFKDFEELKKHIELNILRQLGVNFKKNSLIQTATAETLIRTIKYVSPLLFVVAGKLIDSIGNKSKLNENFIISSLVAKKIKNETKSYGFLILSTSVYLLFLALKVVEYSPYCLLFPIAMLIALIVNHKILAIRIMKGYYGNNAYEAREILQFISLNDDDVSGGGKKLFQESEKESVIIEGWSKEGVSNG